MVSNAPVHRQTGKVDYVFSSETDQKKLLFSLPFEAIKPLGTCLKGFNRHSKHILEIYVQLQVESVWNPKLYPKLLFSHL